MLMLFPEPERKYKAYTGRERSADGRRTQFGEGIGRQIKKMTKRERVLLGIGRRLIEQIGKITGRFYVSCLPDQRAERAGDGERNKGEHALHPNQIFFY